MSQLGLTMAAETSGGRGTNRNRSGGNRRRERRRRDSLPVMVAVVVVLVLLAGVGFYGMSRGWTWFQGHFGGGPDYAGAGTGTVVVEVEAGAPVRAIGRALQTRGVVRSTQAFVTAVEDEPRAQSIQPGSYQLRKEMKASLAVALILDPRSRVGSLSLPEGWRTSKVLAGVTDRSGIPLAQLQAAAASPSGLGLPEYADGQLEGFLFPARYDVNKRMTAQQALAQMVRRFERETAGLDLEAGAEALGVTAYEVVIIASLVQAEARHGEDFGKVSRVIYNRLNSRLRVERRLEFDSTINYARNTSTLNLTNKQIESFDSPYNTYTQPGLPPTPIGNPGKAALVAALNPTPGDWRYFVTVDPRTGETRFTSNYEEFLEWKAEFKRNQGR